MKVLVVGGAGYIGSHAVRLLTQKNHEVTVYDNLSRGHAESVNGVELVCGDLHNRSLLAATIQEREIEAVFHFAAFALVGESVKRPDLYYRNNLSGSIELLEAMRETDCKRLVFSSTTATYGQSSGLPISESDIQRPINPYGFTKLFVEQAIADYSLAFGIGYIGLRYFNAAGASLDGAIGEDHDPETHLIPNVLMVAAGKRDHIEIYGSDYNTPDGTCIRDYVHVEDIAMAHVLALEHLTPGAGNHFNLGTGTGFSVRQIIAECRRVTGHSIPTRMALRRPGDPDRLVANAAKAIETLGWNPRYSSLSTIIQTAWNWHQRHPNGFGSLPSESSRMVA